MKRVPYNRIFNEPKTCTVCAKSYERRIGVPQKQWNKSVFCSKKCKAESQKETQKGKNHSKETRLKMRASAKKGRESRLWRGGKRTEFDILRHSVEYKLWRESVFKRDNWTCIWCFTRSKKGQRVELQADHIKAFAMFPELRFAIDNGRTLCAPCHRKTDTYGIKLFTNQTLT